MELDNFYKSKKVLITGNTGFKGSWLSFWLINMGAKVLGYSLKPEFKVNLFDTLNLSLNYKTIYGDIRDLKKLKNTIEDFEPDIIFHLAAQSLVKDSYENPVYTFETNIIGTVNLLESVRKFEKIKVVINVTSDKCYANNNLGNDFHENDRLGGVDPYSASKACSEIITEAFFKSFYEKSETRIATARSGNVIGGGDWSKNRLIPDVFRAIKSNKPLIVRNPDSIRPWQHVLDPLKGYLLLAKKLYFDNEKKLTQNWNFGPDKKDLKSVRDIVDFFKSSNPTLEVKYEKSDFYESKILKLDVSKSKKYLNWEPKWNFQKSLIQVESWYKTFYSNEGIEQHSLESIKEFNS